MLRVQKAISYSSITLDLHKQLLIEAIFAGDVSAPNALSCIDTR